MSSKLSTQHFFYFNLVWFQLCWFVAVYFQQQFVPLLCLTVGLHFLLSAHRKADIRTMLMVMLVGISVDALSSFLGLLTFAHNQIIPSWLILLWAHFSLTLNHSLKWMSAFPLLIQSSLGGVFGSLSYFAGYRFGAVEFSMGITFTLLVLAAYWAILLPVSITLATKNRIHYETLSAKRD